ncbi:MAG: hypothetical protein ACO1N1_17270 [Dyadobacter fermentans]
MYSAQDRETVALRTAPLEVRGGGADADIPLTREGMDKVAQLYADMLIGKTSRMYLALENIRGTWDATILKVYVHTTDPAEWQAEHLADSISLFGLRRASNAEGLTSFLDITLIVNNLSATSPFHQIRVHIQPERALPETTDVVIGSIRIFLEH